VIRDDVMIRGLCTPFDHQQQCGDRKECRVHDAQQEEESLSVAKHYLTVTSFLIWQHYV